MSKVTRSDFVPKKSLLSAHARAFGDDVLRAQQWNAADIKLASSAIGRPPIFSNTFADVGEDLGYWKKVGLDMSFRWFQRGTDTAKAVITGDVQVGYTATPVAVNLIAAGAPLVIVAGMPNQDWIIGSDLPNVKGCKDLKGQTVAADGINNARWLFLKSEVESCGLKLTEMTPIDLANAPLVKAGIAGSGPHRRVPCRRARADRVQHQEEMAPDPGAGLDQGRAALRFGAGQQKGHRGKS